MESCVRVFQFRIELLLTNRVLDIQLMTRKSFSLITLLLLCKLAYGQQINIYPTSLHYGLSNTGKSETQTINITNNSEKSQAVEIYLGDWNRQENGSHAYYEPGTMNFSCAKWVELSTNFINIPPKESAQLIVTLKAPDNEADLEAMKWAMLYIQGSEFRDKLEGVNTGIQTKVNEVLRFGIHLYQTPGAVNTIDARAVELSQNNEESGVFDMHIENVGGVMIRTKTYLELTNINTGEEFKSEVQECPIFPLGKRVVSLHLPEGLPKGQYSMLGILDYGNPDSLEALEQIVEIK